MRIEWTELALGRVDEIALHIAADNRDAAIRWIIGLFDAVDRLAEFPESGRVVPELETRRASSTTCSTGSGWSASQASRRLKPSRLWARRNTR